MIDFGHNTLVMLGVLIVDVLETWHLALFASVILCDFLLGWKNKILMLFGVIQIIGLVSGYYWALSIFAQQDVAGPWAWARVVGIWFVTTVLVHLWIIAQFLRRKRRTP